MKKTIVQRESLCQLGAWAKNLHPVMQRIYANRNITSSTLLENTLNHLLPFTELKDISKAVLLLAESLQNKESIIIVGDFDADGATSTALAIKALRLMGATNITYTVPNRFKFGYGLTPGIIEEIKHQKPNLIITVDNGISSIEGVVCAKRAGIKVIITDHHLAGKNLPEADAIVNPNQPGDDFPAKSTAGVGIIFYLMLALRAHLRESHWFENNNLAYPNLAQLLDLVALGTVADVVPLEHNNRILVEQGLRRIRSGMACPGIRALIKIGKRNEASLGANDLGFTLGPRLNAAGRLEDMSIGIECLLSNSETEANAIAIRLEQINAERKAIELKMQQQALKELQALLNMDATKIPLGICVYEKNWHQGVVGILAARLKEKYFRPVIAFALADEDEIKGSARSIPGFHIRDALDAIASQHPLILNKFGGHAMAAGLSINKNHFELFRSLFDDQVRKHISPEQLSYCLASDGELTSKELSIDIAKMLKEAGPWGQNFPEPLFNGRFHINSFRILKDRHLKLQLSTIDKRENMDAIAFNFLDDETEHVDIQCGQTVSLAYKLDINEFRGQKTLQLLIEDLSIVY